MMDMRFTCCGLFALAIYLVSGEIMAVERYQALVRQIGDKERSTVKAKDISIDSNVGVIPRGVIYDSNGNITDFFVNGEGRVVSPDGNIIGSVHPDGYAYGSDGRRFGSVGDPSNDVRVPAKKDGDKKQDHPSAGIMQGSQSALGQDKLFRTESAIDTYSCQGESRSAQCRTEKNISNGGKAGWRSQNEAAYKAAEQLFIDGQCFAGQDKEAVFLVLKKGNKYFYGYKSEFVDRNDAHSSAPFVVDKYKRELKEQGYTVVGVVHNHPLHEQNIRTAFSDADRDNARIASAGNHAIDCYMVSCDGSSMSQNGEMLLYRYVKADDKAYIVKKDGSQVVAPDYIKEGSGGRSSALNDADSTGAESGSDVKGVTNDDSQVGVRGWCRCKHSDKHIIGMPPMARYMYSICLTCGKVEKGDGLMIVDYGVNSSDQGRLKEAQAKLLAIPDGQVVIPGKCTCPGTKKASDFVRAGGMMIHIDCGRVVVK